MRKKKARLASTQEQLIEMRMINDLDMIEKSILSWCRSTVDN